MAVEEFKFLKPGAVRVRIAPSPTGFLHIGTARTALFNFLFAQKKKGSFVIRIDDSDLTRSDPRFEKDILEGLKWLGIEWSEGPDTKGKYGPYRQSERKDIYKKYLKKLLSENKAYFCFCSKEDLEAHRQYLLSIGEPPCYGGKCTDLSEKEVKKNLAEGKPSVIRFRVSAKKVEFDDMIRGKIDFDSALIGDFVIARDLTSPLYNFACAVDDFEMEISHVIRGEDHISNTPKQILIQESLDFPGPKYAHLPLILGPDKTKLSKRHGAVAISQYKKEGYLPESLINFMGFLGWNPGTEREIYSIYSLIKEFSLERVQKGGAIFNIKRLDYLNGFYVRKKSIEKLTEICIPYLIEAGFIRKTGENPGNPEKSAKLGLFKEEGKASFLIKETREEISLEFLQKIVGLYQERLKKLSEITDFTDFFFKEKLDYDKSLLVWKEMTDKELKVALDRLRKSVSRIKAENWSKENLENSLVPEAEKLGNRIKGIPDRGYLLWPFRVALTGKKSSAGPFEIAQVLGREKTLKRLKEAKRLVK